MRIIMPMVVTLLLGFASVSLAGPTEDYLVSHGFISEDHAPVRVVEREPADLGPAGEYLVESGFMTAPVTDREPGVESDRVVEMSRTQEMLYRWDFRG